MKNLKTLIMSITLLIIANFVALSVSANDPVSFSGTVTSVQGQRLAIELEDGSQIWGSMEQSVPENSIGQQISGSYLSLGDTFFLVNPVITNGQ